MGIRTMCWKYWKCSKTRYSSICLQDGPNGVRFTDFVTHFPSGLATAATFNKGLMYLRGKAIGKEHRKKVCMLL